MCREGIYPIEGGSLSGESVCLSVGSHKQFCEELLLGSLPDGAYLIRMSGNNDYLHDK